MSRVPDEPEDDGALRPAQKVRIMWDEYLPQHKEMWRHYESWKSIRVFMVQVFKILAFLLALAGSAYGLFKAVAG